ncbi:hypothetical protein SETIT_8G026500v2, partial [Setaria italica]
HGVGACGGVATGAQGAMAGGARGGQCMRLAMHSRAMARSLQGASRTRVWHAAVSTRGSQRTTTGG